MPLQYRRRWLEFDPGLGFSVDWSNPITNNLRACILANEQGGNPRDLILFNTAAPSATAPTWSQQQMGVCRKYVRASSTLDDFGQGQYDITTNPPSLSIMTQFQVTTLPSALANIAGKAGTGTQAARVGYTIALSAANAIVFNLWDSSGQSSLSSTVTAVVGVIYMVIGTYDGSIQRIYVNGVQKNTSGIGRGSTSNASIGLQMGGTTSTGGGYFDGNVNFLYLWNRALLSKEANMLYENPYQIIKPLSAKRFSNALPYLPFNLASYPDRIEEKWIGVEY